MICDCDTPRRDFVASMLHYSFSEDDSILSTVSDNDRSEDESRSEKVSRILFGD
jgi:hypothetical protein